MSSSSRPSHRTLSDYIAWCLGAERGGVLAEPAGLPLDDEQDAPQNASCDAPETGTAPCPFEARQAHLATPLHRALAYWRLRTTDVAGFAVQVEHEAADIVAQWHQTGARRPLLASTEPAVPEVADWRLDWAFHEQQPPAVARSLDMEALYIRRALRPVFVAGINAGGTDAQFLAFATRQARALIEAFAAAADGFEFLVCAPLEPREPLR